MKLAYFKNEKFYLDEMRELQNDISRVINTIKYKIGQEVRINRSQHPWFITNIIFKDGVIAYELEDGNHESRTEYQRDLHGIK